MKLQIVVRFSNVSWTKSNLKDLKLPLIVNYGIDDVNKLVTVKWLKSTIRERVPEISDHRLRLIYNGRILNEKTDFKKEVFDTKVKQIDDSSIQEDKIYIHCIVGDKLTNDQLRQENQLDNRAQEVTTAPEVIGFDRLLSQGFTQEDVNDLRRQFHSIYNPDSMMTSRSDQIDDVEEQERIQRNIRASEERWIESTAREPNRGQEQTPLAEPNGSQTSPSPMVELDDSTANEDLLIGLLIGIFLGVISLVFLIADNSIFNKRQQMSIIAGIFVNFAFAIVRGLQT